MPSFKPKPVKKIKIDKKNLTTLDGQHKEFVNEFYKDEHDTIPKLKLEKQHIIMLLENNVTAEEENKLSVEQILDYKDRIVEIGRLVVSLKAKKKEYFLDNSKHIFDYFENKKNISKGEVVQSTSNKLDTFFKIKTDNIKVIESTNNNIFQKYLNNIDDTFLDLSSFIKPTDICQSCHKGELISMDDEGILAQFQGKETTQIPPEVIENLKQQIKKERVDMSNLTYYKTKDLLKKLGYNKYYEHINFIKDKLGIKPPIISQELEETLCNFFMEIQYPYAKHCPDYRVNFLHYYYVLYKLFELLSEHHYLPEIPMLKDREKLIEQDIIWKKICEDLDWEFIATI